MPTLIPTPWIPGPPKVGEMFLQGYGQGAQAAEASARIQQAQAQLAAQQQQHAIESDLKQQQIAQNARLESQRMEISKAYHDAQIGINQQKLKEASQLNQLRILQAAKKMQAQGLMEQEVGEMVSGGMDEGRARMIATSRHATDLGITGQGQAALLKQLAPAPPLRFESDPLTGRRYAIGPTGAPVQEREGASSRDPAIGALMRQVADNEKLMATKGIDKKVLEQYRADTEVRKRKVNELRADIGLSPIYPTEVPTGVPAKLKVLGIRPAGSAAPTTTATAPAAAPAAAPSVRVAAAGGMSIPMAATTAPAPAAIPQSVAATPAKAQSPWNSTLEILKSYRAGQLSKTDARNAIDKYFPEDASLKIVGPEQVEKKKEDKGPYWHFEMKKDASGKMTHVYAD